MTILCKTCNRRPSERFGVDETKVVGNVRATGFATCKDPIHDLADALVDVSLVNARAISSHHDTCCHECGRTFETPVVGRCPWCGSRQIGRKEARVVREIRGVPIQEIDS